MSVWEALGAVLLGLVSPFAILVYLSIAAVAVLCFAIDGVLYRRASAFELAGLWVTFGVLVLSVPTFLVYLSSNGIGAGSWEMGTL